MFERQTVHMLWVENDWKTNSTNVGNKTCLKDKQYKCCEENMFNRQAVQMLWVKEVSKTNSTNVMCKTYLKDKQCKCCE